MAENETFSQDQLQAVAQRPASVQASNAFLSFANDMNKEEFKALAQTYMGGLQGGQIDPNIVLGTMAANDFAATKYITAQNDSDIDQIFLDIINYLNTVNAGTSNALAAASPDARQVFDRNDFSYTPPETEQAPIEEKQQPETEAHIPEQTTEEATEQNNPATASTSPGLRGNPIMPRIEIDEPAISHSQIIGSVRDIQARLETLPDDPAERREALVTISDELEEMAVTLAPSMAGEGRLGNIPPLSSDWNYENELETLNNHIDVILLHDDVSELGEYLVQASHQASIVARDPGNLIIPDITPNEPEPADPVPETKPPVEEEPAPIQTQTRLSELLDGRGYHNDHDGYNDYNALEDAFSRAAELGITTEHIENIRVRMNEPDFILKTSAAIKALDAYNQGVQAEGEKAGLSAFFNAISPEDLVRDQKDTIDDTNDFDREERAQVREVTLRIEDSFKP